MSKHERAGRTGFPGRGRHGRPPSPATRSLWPLLLATTGLALGGQASSQADVSASRSSLPRALAEPAGAVPLPAPLARPLDAGAVAASTALPAAALALPTDPRAGSIPRRVLSAYVRAERTETRTSPGCHLSWTLLAGIGWIESHHARSGGSSAPTWDGMARPAVLGPLLTGGGFVAIPDTDRGRLDGDSLWDRAVGPMQFIPSTWRRWGADGNSDGRSDPQQIDDAALAAADYLCAAGTDLRTPNGLYGAVFSYNHSDAYVASVLTTAQGYGATVGAAAVLASLPAPTAPTSASPSPAAVAPGRGHGHRPGPPSSPPSAGDPSTPTGTSSPTSTPSPNASGPSPTSEPSASPAVGTTPSGAQPGAGSDPAAPPCSC